MAPQLDEAMKILEQIEKIGGKIVDEKELIVEFDRKRNKDREALRGIEKSSDNKVWLCCANMFVRVDKEMAKKIIKQDQDDATENIEQMRTSIKQKVNQLRELEGKKAKNIFNLKPLAKKELASLNSLLP